MRTDISKVQIGDTVYDLKDLNDTVNDPVNHPAHYETGGIECKDAMIATFGNEWYMHFCILNAFKYIWRCKHKGKFKEDVEKARWYLNNAVDAFDRDSG